MFNINTWAAKWSIPSAAIDDMRESIVSSLPAECPPRGLSSEAGVLSAVRLEASRKGARLWRNNKGAVTDQNGNFIRYGLANESTTIDKIIKSSDLIGIRRVILPGGGIIGQFVAREIKKPGWKYSGTEREKAQLNFLNLINSFGGDGQFTTSEGSL